MEQDYGEERHLKPSQDSLDNSAAQRPLLQNYLAQSRNTGLHRSFIALMTRQSRGYDHREEKSAAEQHVEILKQRCYLLQSAQERFSAASPRCIGSWQLQRGAAALQRGASLRTAFARFGQLGWPIAYRVRFYPRGLEASKPSHCALEITFEEAPVVEERAFDGAALLVNDLRQRLLGYEQAIAEQQKTLQREVGH